MAFLLPENIPSRNDVPNRLNLVGRVLRDALPDEVIVWLERDSTDDPYLLVLDPSCGVLLLDVPRRLPYKSKSKWKKPPKAEGVRETVRRRMSELGEKAPAAELENLGVACALAIPDVSATEARWRGWKKSDRTIFVEEDFEPAKLREAFRRVLGGDDRVLEAPEVQKVRALVNPEIVIDRPGGAR